LQTLVETPVNYYDVKYVFLTQAQKQGVKVKGSVLVSIHFIRVNFIRKKLSVTILSPLPREVNSELFTALY
jgi:hypothetical protein